MQLTSELAVMKILLFLFPKIDRKPANILQTLIPITELLDQPRFGSVGWTSQQAVFVGGGENTTHNIGTVFGVDRLDHIFKFQLK